MFAAGWANAFPALTSLQIGGNAAIHGHLPDWGGQGNLQSLTLLSADDCGLKGTLPAWTGLRLLSDISLDNNHLSGKCPGARGTL